MEEEDYFNTLSDDSDLDDDDEDELEDDDEDETEQNEIIEKCEDDYIKNKNWKKIVQSQELIQTNKTLQLPSVHL